MGLWDNLLKIGTTTANVLSKANDLGKLYGTNTSAPTTNTSPLANVKPTTNTVAPLAPKTPGVTFVGNSADLPYATNIFGENARYVDYTKHPDYQLSKGDYVLGGLGAEGMGSLTNDVLANAGATRLAGADRLATSGLVQGVYDKMYPNSVKPTGGNLTTNADGTMSVSPFNIPWKSMDDLKAEASSTLTPQIENKKLGITNNLNTTLQGYENSKKTAQTNADKAIVSANQDTERAKASIFNNAAAHGLSRSSIQDSENGYATLANGVTKGNINTSLNDTLAGIQGNMDLATLNSNNEKTALDNSLPDLINQYVNNAWNSQIGNLMNAGQLNRGIANDNNTIIANSKAAEAQAGQTEFENWLKTQQLGIDSEVAKSTIAKNIASANKTNSSGTGTPKLNATEIKANQDKSRADVEATLKEHSKDLYGLEAWIGDPDQVYALYDKLGPTQASEFIKEVKDQIDAIYAGKYGEVNIKGNKVSFN